MGSVRFGIPRELALALKAKHGLKYFTETGTLEGHTAQWAAAHFESVVTVDVNNPPLWQIGNIHALRMDSAEFLEKFSTSGSTLFWLDAHTNESCPVLREIAAVNKSEFRNVILVDDARLFGDLPAWPSKQSVIEALEYGGRRTVWEIEDVLVAEPCP